MAAAITSSKVGRSEIFLTTKVPCCPAVVPELCQGMNGTVAQHIAQEVAILGKPVDLLLLHWPCATLEDTVKAYRGLEEALDDGLTRSIGVSNFNASLLEQMLRTVNVKPAVNQCSHSIGAHNSSHLPEYGGDELTAEFCADHGIVYQAYSPLGGLSGIDVFKDPTVIMVATRHNVSAAQVALRWLIQQNISVVTSGENPAHLAQDMDLFDFRLTTQEMQLLAAL